MVKTFKGYYFKHQKGSNTIAIIPGVASGKAFMQIITNEKSYFMNFDTISFGKDIKIGENVFTTNGITLKNDLIQGKIDYLDITPLKYDIMGPFKYMNMQCSHGVLSMNHKLQGSIKVENKTYDLSDGKGYIEMDKGTSFPSKYIWLHCNDFVDKCSIMVSIANIPFLCTTFTGCIAVVYFENKEYRFASYLGTKILHCSKDKIVLLQRKYLLKIELKSDKSYELLSPHLGEMSNRIRESNNSFGQFSMYKNHILMFHKNSNNVSLEYNNI